MVDIARNLANKVYSYWHHSCYSYRWRFQRQYVPLRILLCNFERHIYIAVLYCAMLFRKFGGFRISISHILGNISHILGNISHILGNISHILGDIINITQDVLVIWDITDTPLLWCSSHPGYKYLCTAWHTGHKAETTTSWPLLQSKWCTIPICYGPGVLAEPWEVLNWTRQHPNLHPYAETWHWTWIGWVAQNCLEQRRVEKLVP